MDRASVAGSFMSDGMRDRLRAQITTLAETASVQLHESAKSKAPVRTGKYRDSLIVEDRSDGARVSFRVWSKVVYARFIRSAKQGDKRTRSFRAVFTEDLGKPARAARAKLLTDAAQVAVEVLSG